MAKNNTPILIGVTGYAGHGKSTIANYLKTLNFQEYAFADPLKLGCLEMFGLSKEQIYDNDEKNTIDPFWGVSPREILQKVGTELMRNQLKTLFPNMNLGETGIIWIRNFERYYEKNKHQSIVISDVRNIDEAETIKKLGGYVILVNNPNIKMDDPFRQHLSEQKISFIPYNFHVNNNGTIEELLHGIDGVIKLIKNKDPIKIGQLDIDCKWLSTFKQ